MTTNNLNKSYSILRIIGLLLVLVAFAIFIYNTQKQEKNIQTKNTEINKKDSILTKIAIQMDRKDTLKSIVSIYFKFRASHDVEELDKFYSDTIIRYFINLKNCRKEEVKLADKNYWKRHQKDAFHIKSEPEIILDEYNSKALIHGLQCRTENTCVNQIVEIKFDSKNKINNVRAYFEK